MYGGRSPYGRAHPQDVAGVTGSSQWPAVMHSIIGEISMRLPQFHHDGTGNDTRVTLWMRQDDLACVKPICYLFFFVALCPFLIISVMEFTD